MTTQQNRLIHIKQLYLRAESGIARSDDVSLILFIQLLDFTVETFLKLVIDGFPRPTHFAPPQSGYYQSIKDLESSRYNPRMESIEHGMKWLGGYETWQMASPSLICLYDEIWTGYMRSEMMYSTKGQSLTPKM